MNFKNSSTKLNNWSLRQPVKFTNYTPRSSQNSEIFLAVPHVWELLPLTRYQKTVPPAVELQES